MAGVAGYMGTIGLSASSYRRIIGSNDRVRVAVSEGTVQVNTNTPTLFNRISRSFTGQSAPGPALARVNRGEAISFQSQTSEATPQRIILTHMDPSEPSRWRDGWLVYRDEPLREVLADVARYIDGNLEVADTLTTDSHFTGAIYKGSINEWLQSLPSAFAVKVQIDGRRILIAGTSVSADGRQP